MWNQIKRDLPTENLKLALTFLTNGTYDPATKKELVSKRLPEIVKLLKT